MSWLSLGRSFSSWLVGPPLGIAGARGVGQLLQNLLVQIGRTDPVTLSTIVLVLAGVAVFACLVPARRAARLDPMVALRVE